MFIKKFLFVASLVFICLTILFTGLISPIHGQPPPEKSPQFDYTIYLPIVLKPNTPPPPSAETGIGYATSEDRTLIRWLWNEADLGAATFFVYRQADGEAESLLAQVTPETDPGSATSILNNTDSRWPSLANDLIAKYSDQGITNVTELQTFITQSGLIDLKLAAEYYPVALILGWGYLDQDFVDGESYTYRVEAHVNGQVRELGSVSVVAGQLTPLEAPTGVFATDMSEASDFVQARAEDWTMAQRNLRYDKRVYLGWELEGGDETAYPEAWITGWDIYRAPFTDVTQLEHVSGMESVQPMPALIPMDDTAPLTGPLAYEQVPYFYQDEPPGYGDFYYRVAPRDLMGQIREWPAHSPQFSEAVLATSQDFTPPPPPSAIEATGFPTYTDKVLVTWAMTDTSDVDHFQIERTLSLSNSTPVHLCQDDALCWQVVATATTTGVWTDTDPTLEVVRWYRVRSVDDFGNRSGPIGPVQGVLHDVTPPPQPSLRGTDCDRDPNQSCLLGTNISTDTTHLRISCKFSEDGEELFIKEIAGNTLSEFNLEQEIFVPAVSVENVMCTLIAVDAHGNLSEPSLPATMDLKSPEVKQISAPIITGTETLPGGDNGWTARLNWAVLDSPGLGGFDIVRQNLADDSLETFNVADGLARSYSDATVVPGENYSYTVIAKPKTALFGEAQKSQAQFYQVINNGSRPLQKMAWVDAQWLGGSNSVSLAWEPLTANLAAAGVYLAVYRSRYQNSDYIQISPISLQSAGMYLDSQVSDPNFWYVVVQFDPRTGEPIAYTDPIKPSVTSLQLNYGTPAVISTTSSMTNCTPVDPVLTETLRFGGGFEVELDPTQLVVDPVTKVFTSNSLGNLILRPASGPITLTGVILDGISVGDAQNHVCGGELQVNVQDHQASPIRMEAPDGWQYSIHQIIARPWYGSETMGRADIRLTVPTHTTVITQLGGTELSYVELSTATTQLHAGLMFSGTVDLPSELPSHSCTSPAIGFNLHTLPLTVIPLNTISFDPYGFTMSDSCTHYDDRFTPGAGSGRPSFPDFGAGDANDGYLRDIYQSATATLTIDGLSGDYSTLINASLDWIASYPYGFNVSLAGGQIDLSLQNHRIISGSISGTSGSVQMAYHRTISEALQAQLTGTFTQATIDAGGAIYAQVDTTANVGWLAVNAAEDGFELDAGQWELYLGPVTSPGLPVSESGTTASAVMWDARPGDTVDVGSSIPLAELEPGLNRRLGTANLTWANCAGPAVTFDTAQDTYLRHGGISQQHKAKLNGVPFELDIHGYEAALDNFYLSFLDNYIWASSINGELNLPFPANINLQLINIWLKPNACVGGGELPKSGSLQTLDYWDLDTQLQAVEFRAEPAPDQALPNWDQVLWAIGEFEVPHFKKPNQNQTTPLAGEAAFRPDGTFFDFQFFYDQVDFEVQGFPILVEGLRLSNVGEDPNWATNANASAPPGGNNKSPNWNAQGFVGLASVWVAPYFTTFAGQDDEPGMETYLLGWDDYIGFDGQPSLEKAWADLDAVKLLLEYVNIMYVYDEDAQEGTFVAFRNVGFVPEAVIPPFEAKHQVINLDISLILRGDTLGSFIGLSSGVAAFRALAEVSEPSLAAPPAPETLDEWGDKLAMSNIDGYKTLLGEVWSGYDGQTYLKTTDILDAYDDGDDTDLPTDFGGGTGGLLDDKGVSITRPRGDIIFSGLGSGLQLESFQLSTELTVKGADAGEGGGEGDEEQKPMLYVERIGFEINRHADFILEAKNIQSSLFKNTLESMDATIRINPVLPQFEGGVTLYHLDLKLVHFNQASAVIGVGAELNYIGLQAAGYPKAQPDLQVSGAVLFGTIDPNSPVLSAHFEDLMTKLQEEVPGEPPLGGFYLRLYVGGIPIYDIGCMVEVKAGVGIALWYFAFGENGDTFGGQIRGSIYGTGLCIVSVRGDVTLTYSNTNGNEVFNGQAYVAGGIGKCEPATWDGWNNRWWNDKWCAQGGAYVEVEYKTIDSSWEVEYELDREKLF